METTHPPARDTAPARAPSHPGASGQHAWLIAILLADVTCFGIVMPLLASYAHASGVGATAVGLLVATYSVMHFVLAPWWGRLSDRIGRRPVLLIGLVGTLGSSILFALADTFLLLFISRLVGGGLGATLNVAQAYAADQSPPEGRTRVMGFIGAAFGIGFIIGPTIGGITSRFGDAAPGIAATLIASVALLVAWFKLPEPAMRRARDAEQGEPPRGVTGILLRVFAAAFASTLAFTVLYVTFPLHAELALGYDRSRVSYLFAFTGLMTALVQGGLVGRLASRWGEARLIVLGGALMGLGLGLLPAVQLGDLGILLVALAFLGFGFGMVGPAEAGYVSRTVGAAWQGHALGKLQSANAVARIVGPVAAGAVTAAGGPVLAFCTAAGAGLMAAWIGTRLGPPRREVE